MVSTKMTRARTDIWSYSEQCQWGIWKNDNNENLDNAEDCEQLWPDQSWFQQVQATSQSAYTGCSSVDTTTEMPYSPIPPDVSKEGDEQNEPHQQIL
jgi:hypothetical protein